MKLLYIALLVGCGTDSGPEVLDELHVPPAPDNGVQVITPIFENILPGSDYETCVWTDQIFEKETDIKSTLGFQNEPPGHHVILFYTLQKQPPNTARECTDTDMATFRYLTGNGANGVINEAPGDLVFRIPAGAQLVVNAHYLNAGDEVLRGQSLINVNFAGSGVHTPSGSMAIVDTTLEVPVGVSTQHMTCTFEDQFKLWYLIPHMHRWGTHITLDYTKAGEETPTRLVDLPWREQYTFHPPENRYELTEPFVANAGDKIDVGCTWNNTEGRPLTFGFEMCVAFGQYIDVAAKGGVACNTGDWIPF